ncbi:MAG: hypothetical protein K2Y23_14460 [Cyanobacteria bacterium]|nr:hypothetical protein [Cyanobacteriota bacterium]
MAIAAVTASSKARRSVRYAAAATVAVLGAYLTTRISILTVLRLFVALDAAALIYWFYFRRRRAVRPAWRESRTPLRSLADVMLAAGVVLLLSALWLTMLGALTQFGVTDARTADWGALAASGFLVKPDQPVAFGARSLVVAAAVWVVGFGLARASGERA